jgi:hypothetical protein
MPVGCLRLALSIFVALVATNAAAQCPPSCMGGGGPPTSDCFLAYGGASAPTITCMDGDPACDLDGTIDGTCTFGLTACTNETVGACTATPLDAPPTAIAKGTGAEAFIAALAQLSTATPACTEPGLVKLTIANSPSKLKPAKVTLKVTAVAGGKKDKDKLRFVCNPGQPGLAANVQPIFTETCTFVGCHSGAIPERNLNLEEGEAAASLALKALGNFKFLRVKPGSIKKSYLAKGLLGIGARQMPDGCPNILPPVERCLTPTETYTILAWIQAGARP